MWNTPEPKEPPPAGLEPVESDRRVYRASMMGACVSVLAAHAAGYEPDDLPDSLKKGAQEGVDNEPVILEMLRQERELRSVTYPEMAELKERGVIAGYGMVPTSDGRGDVQVQVRMNVGSGAEVRCHLDDLMVPGGSKPVWMGQPGDGGTLDLLRGIEVKAFGDALWNDWLKNKFDGKGLLAKYAWQVTAQRLSLGYPILFVVGHKNDVGLVYELDILEVDDPPVPAGQFKMKVIKADRAARNDDIPMCDDVSWPCAYHHMPFHPDAAPLEVVADEELFAKCMALTEAGGERKIANEHYDEQKRALDKYLADKGIARGQKMIVADGGKRVEFEWVEEVVAEHTRAESARSFPKVKVIK